MTSDNQTARLIRKRTIALAADLPPGITWHMVERGMAEWDAAMKDGLRMWPQVLGRVFNAMKGGVTDE